MFKKAFVTALIITMMTAGSAIADNFGPKPANYEDAVETYVKSRMVDSRAAKFRYISEPYKVYTTIRGYEGLACWAIDVRVKSRLPSGGYGGYIPYTVLIMDGDVLAFESDVQKVTRL